MADIPEEMVQKAAQGMATACGRGDVGTLPGSDREYFRSRARAALAAALAGRTVVDLPVAERGRNGDYSWVAPGAKRLVEITAYVEENGAPYVEDEYDATRADDAEQYALAKLAAARKAIQLASESSGDPYTDNDDGSDEYARAVNESGAEAAALGISESSGDGAR